MKVFHAMIYCCRPWASDDDPGFVVDVYFGQPDGDPPTEEQIINSLQVNEEFISYELFDFQGKSFDPNKSRFKRFLD